MKRSGWKTVSYRTANRSKYRGMVSRKYFAIFSVLMISILAAAGETAESAAKRIELSQNSVRLYAGESVRLRLSGTKAKIQWNSSDPHIAAVNRKGKVKAKAAGTAVITAKSKKKTFSCKVRVGNHITGVRLLSAASVTLEPGDTSRIQASVTGKKVYSKQLTYRSEDKKIATVSAKGKITAKAGGLTRIIVQSKAVNSRGKKEKVSVAVYVQGNTDTREVPLPSGEAVLSTSPSVTLQEAVNKIPAPDTATLVASTMVVKDNAQTRTLYFLNKEYQGQMKLSVFGHMLSSSRTVPEALSAIATTGAKQYISEQGVRVLYAESYYGQCMVQNLATKEKVWFQVYPEDSAYGSAYALIVAQGDTRNIVSVQ